MCGHISAGGEALFARRGGMTVHPGKYVASEAARQAWLDSVHDKKVQPPKRSVWRAGWH